MEKYLEELGFEFKKVYPDELDNEYFYYQKDLQHHFLKGLHIIIEGDIIIVWCAETRFGSRSDVAIYNCEYNENNLKNILKWLAK